MKANRKLVALCIVSIILVSAVVAVYFTRLQVAPQISLAPSTFVAVQGTQVAFTVYGLESSGVASVYFGDGHAANTTSTATYTYPNPGRYLVAAEEFVDGQPVASTFNTLQTIQITPQVGVDLAPLISVPSVSFDVSKNPGAPVVRVGDTAYLYGGFLEPPTGNNVTIMEYTWDFGNGATKTVAANSTSFKPVENPAFTMYDQPGLYGIRLTLVTENSTSMATYETSVEQTVAVGSASQAYALFLYAGSVPNPSVINVVENHNPPRSFDPDIVDEGAGIEIDNNILSTLLIYNGSSTTNFIPMAAAEVPSLSNGGISPDYTSYTFHIRTGLRFSNGDPLTAYDVYYSIVRSLLFCGSLGASGAIPGAWDVAQYLVTHWPGIYGSQASLVKNATDISGYNSIVSSITYSNATDTITFRLIEPVAPQSFYTAIAESFGTGILDSSWLQRVGAGITFTPAGFYAYEKEGNQGNFNLAVQNDPVSSGPYLIQSYVPGQSISLVPNPGFPGVPGSPGVPKVNNTIVIQWVKDPETSYELFRSGQADIVIWLPSEYFPLINQQVANGEAKIYQSPTLAESLIWFGNWGGSRAYNETDMKLSFGSQYNCPTDYFLNLDVRKAWTYAFDYPYYMDEILGNKKYGVEVGSSYAGVGNLQGLPFQVPESELQNVPVYNLTYAKQLLQESGEYDTAISIPFPISPVTNIGIDNQTQFAVARAYAYALNSIDPNIVITPVVDNSSAPSDAYQIGFGHWYASAPAPYTFIDYWYRDPFAPHWLNSTGHPDQAAMFAQMNSLIAEADSTTNATLAAQDYEQIEQIGINLYLYVYLDQPYYFLVVKPYMNGYQGQVSYVLNPMIYTTQYAWWVKTCGSIQACSGRSIGP